MPNKKKRFFTKNNSTKYLLYTEGRDENGEKITQNVLVPVSGKHDLAGSLLFPHLANLGGSSDASNFEENIEKKETKRSCRVTKYSESTSDKDLDLDKILDEMAGSSDESEEDGEFDALKEKMKSLGFFDEPNNKSGNSRSKVHVEILDEDDFSDEFGQFSDAESDSDFETPTTVKKRPVLTSAKADCPETLKILNEGFDKVLEEYADDQIGGLDDEEICGVFSAENERVQDFITRPLEKDIEDVVIGECDESIKKKILLFTEVEHPEHFVQVEMKKPLEWDCESILSTYSNKYNHPVVIKEEGKIRKIKIPHNPLKSNLTKSQLKTLESESESEDEEDENDNVSVATSFNIRIKGETQEQKRERKALFKEAKRESRKLKKENKLAFKNEKKLQTGIAINARKNMGIKLV